MPADRNRGASNPHRAMSDVPSHQIYLSRKFLAEQLPRVAEADAARAALSAARAASNAATVAAAKAINALSPLQTAMRKADARLSDAEAGTPAHNDRVATEARIRKCERTLATAEARVTLAQRELAEARGALSTSPKKEKIDRATFALKQARDRVAAAEAEAERAADEAMLRKVAVAHAHSAALNVAVTPRLRRDVNEHLRILESAGQPYHEHVN